MIVDFTNSDEYEKHLGNVINYTFPNEVIINDFLNKMGSPDDPDPSLPMHQWSEINKIIALKNNLSLFNQNGKIINYFSYITTADKSFGQEYLSQLKHCGLGIIGYLVFFGIAILLLIHLSMIAGYYIGEEKKRINMMINNALRGESAEELAAGKVIRVSTEMSSFFDVLASKKFCWKRNNNSQNGSYFSWFKSIFYDALIVVPELLFFYKFVKVDFQTNNVSKGKKYAALALIVCILTIIGYYFMIVYLEYPVSQLFVLDGKAASFIDTI